MAFENIPNYFLTQMPGLGIGSVYDSIDVTAPMPQTPTTGLMIEEPAGGGLNLDPRIAMGLIQAGAQLMANPHNPAAALGQGVGAFGEGFQQQDVLEANRREREEQTEIARQELQIRRDEADSKLKTLDRLESERKELAKRLAKITDRPEEEFLSLGHDDLQSIHDLYLEQQKPSRAAQAEIRVHDNDLVAVRPDGTIDVLRQGSAEYDPEMTLELWNAGWQQRQQVWAEKNRAEGRKPSQEEVNQALLRHKAQAALAVGVDPSVFGLEGGVGTVGQTGALNTTGRPPLSSFNDGV